MHGEFNVVLSIAKSCQQNGGRALIVGGWVRDIFLGRSSKDIDVEVYGLSAETVVSILSQFGEVDSVGQAFGVLKIKGLNIDVSMPRKDSKKGSGHKGISVQTDASLSVQEAAARRDFTMNSMAFDPIGEGIIDPFGGRQDLLNGLLRVTNPEQFVEDPLRILRAAQFLARFELRPSDELLEICARTSNCLSELPPERHFAEWEKLLMKGQKPSLGLEFLRKINALPIELSNLVGLNQDPEWHPEGCVWTHTLMATDELAQMPNKTLPLMFGILLHDVGKAGTTTFDEDGHIRSKGHPEKGAPLAISFMERLKAGNELTNQVAMLVEAHLAPVSHKDASRQGMNRLARKLGMVGLSLSDVEIVARADHFGRTTEDAVQRLCPNGDAFLEKAKGLNVFTHAPPDIVMGRHLIAAGFAPGVQFGVILKKCRDIQDETGLENAEEILKLAI